MTLGRPLVRLGAGLAASAAVAICLPDAGVAARRAAPQAAPPTGCPNLLSLDLGARVERAISRYDFAYGPHKLLDKDPATVWASNSNAFPQELVFAFAARDGVLVSGLTVTFPRPGTDPGWGGPNDGKVRAIDVEVWTSPDSPAAGFRKVASASLPMEAGPHAIILPSAVRAKFVKLVVGRDPEAYGPYRYATPSLGEAFKQATNKGDLADA